MSKQYGKNVRWVGWGAFDVGGARHARTENEKIGVGKDIRVIGDDVSAWKERKGHRLTAAMITGVYGKGIETLVIGTGAVGAIDWSESVIESIKEHGIRNVIVQPTPAACETFNALSQEGIKVALLAHATC
ncbi:MAG TPA: Mth938-like domain-containing protein [Thermoanaerobaculia bacterium]